MVAGRTPRTTTASRTRTTASQRRTIATPSRLTTAARATPIVTRVKRWPGSTSHGDFGSHGPDHSDHMQAWTHRDKAVRSNFLRVAPAFWCITISRRGDPSQKSWRIHGLGRDDPPPGAFDPATGLNTADSDEAGHAFQFEAGRVF